MTEPKVLVRQARGRTAPVQPMDLETGWRWVGWVGTVLLLAGLGDLALALYPPGFGTPEWEFATVAQVFASLPLVTMGFAGLLASGVALGRRVVTLGVAWFLIVWTVLLLIGLGLFLTNVPIAFRAAEGVALIGIRKAVVKTVWLGAVFMIAYGWAAIAALRHVRGTSET